MKKKQRFSFGTLVIVDLMATSFGVIVLLIIVVVLNEERLIVENAPVVNRIYNADEKFKIISSQLTHGEDLEKFKDLKNNRDKNDSSPTLYIVKVYDDYLEYESFNEKKFQKITKDITLEDDIDFMSFLRKIKKEKHRLSINIYGNGMYYKFMDLINAYKIRWYSSSPMTSKGNNIYGEYINKDVNLSNESNSTKLIKTDKNQNINKTELASQEINQTEYNDINETNYINQIEELMKQRIEYLRKNIILLIILLIVIIFEFRFHYLKYFTKQKGYYV